MSEKVQDKKTYKLEDSSNQKIDSNFSDKSAPKSVYIKENPFYKKGLSQDLYNRNNKQVQNEPISKKLSENNIGNNNNTIINNFRKKEGLNNIFDSNNDNFTNNVIQSSKNIKVKSNDLSQNNINNDSTQSNNNEPISSYNSLSISTGSQNASNYIDDDKTITKTRLSDMGNKSYLNANLQCLGNITKLKNYFFNEELEKKIEFALKYEKMRLSFTFQRLFYHLNQRNEIYPPESLLEVLQKINILFKREKTELNPKFCLNIILNQLHDELNIKSQTAIPYPINQYNEEEVIYNGKYNYESQNSSIISELFNYYELKEYRCMKCGRREFHLQNFFTFELDLLEYYNLRKKNKNSIYDCLNYAMQKKVIKNFCNKCNKFLYLDWQPLSLLRGVHRARASRISSVLVGSRRGLDVQERMGRGGYPRRSRDQELREKSL